MKYAAEVIDLMAAYPGRGWKMAEIVRYVSGGRDLDATERDATRKGVYRVLCVLAKGRQVVCTKPTKQGAPARFAWCDGNTAFKVPGIEMVKEVS